MLHFLSVALFVARWPRYYSVMSQDESLECSSRDDLFDASENPKAVGKMESHRSLFGKPRCPAPNAYVPVMFMLLVRINAQVTESASSKNEIQFVHPHKFLQHV